MTYRGLGVREWVGVWQDRIMRWACALRGHQWTWTPEYEDIWYTGRDYRQCGRCGKYEER
jgi:hypothetical protein